MTEKIEELYFTKPTETARLFHIFNKEDRSLCGKYMMFIKDPEQCEPVKETNIFSSRQDCRACWRKAGLNILPTGPVKSEGANK